MYTIKTKNVFISHHYKDDDSVDKLTDLLQKNGYNIRNSSIRAKVISNGKIFLAIKKWFEPFSWSGMDQL